MLVYELKENYEIILPLIRALDNYLTELYPPQSNHILSMNDLLKPNVRVIVVEDELGGSLIGCGAIVLGTSFCEIKRMFVLPQARGKGVGLRLLLSLEKMAVEQGFDKAYLETGIHQPEAIRLYEKAGYKRTIPYGSYLLDPLSVFMVKDLKTP